MKASLATPVIAAAFAALAATPALGAVTTARLDAEPRAAVNADGHLWVLADRGGARVLIETGALTGRPTGREVVVATGVARDVPGTGNRTIRPSVTAVGGGIWTVDPVNGDAVRVDAATAAVTVRATIVTPAGRSARHPDAASTAGR